jgi:hypothetical protein
LADFIDQTNHGKGSLFLVWRRTTHSINTLYALAAVSRTGQRQLCATAGN